MTTREQRATLYDRARRNAMRAAAYLNNASRSLHTIISEQQPVPTDYWTLLDTSLTAALEIVEALPDDYFESSQSPDWFHLGLSAAELKYNTSDGPLEAARKVVAAIEARQARAVTLVLIARLEDTTGRTPEEAASYKAKADQLRARLERRQRCVSGEGQRQRGRGTR